MLNPGEKADMGESTAVHGVEVSVDRCRLRPAVETDPDLARAIAFMRALHLRTATRVEELPYGLAFFEPELPAVWDLNLIWIDELPSGMTAPELAAEAERVQAPAGLAHRRIELNTRGRRGWRTGSPPSGGSTTAWSSWPTGRHPTGSPAASR